MGNWEIGVSGWKGRAKRRVNESLQVGWDLCDSVFTHLLGFLLASSAGGAQGSDLSRSGFCVSVLLG